MRDRGGEQRNCPDLTRIIHQPTLIAQRDVVQTALQGTFYSSWNVFFFESEFYWSNCTIAVQLGCDFVWNICIASFATHHKSAVPICHTIAKNAIQVEICVAIVQKCVAFCYAIQVNSYPDCAIPWPSLLTDRVGRTDRRVNLWWNRTLSRDQ